MKKGKADFGFNARAEVYETLFKAVVIDPTKVTTSRWKMRHALPVFADHEYVVADKLLGLL